MAHKLDIFDTLAAIDKKDKDFLDRQTAEVKKAFAPVVVLRWMSSMGNGDVSDINLTLVNEVVNQNFFDLADHPELQYKLMTATGMGRVYRRNWIPMSKGRKKISAVHDFFIEKFPDCNDFEISGIIKKLTRETFEQYLQDCGTDPVNMKDLMNAYDQLCGIITPKKAVKRK